MLLFALEFISMLFDYLISPRRSIQPATATRANQGIYYPHKPKYCSRRRSLRSRCRSICKSNSCRLCEHASPQITSRLVYKWDCHFEQFQPLALSQLQYINANRMNKFEIRLCFYSRIGSHLSTHYGISVCRHSLNRAGIGCVYGSKVHAADDDDEWSRRWSTKRVC